MRSAHVTSPYASRLALFGAAVAAVAGVLALSSVAWAQPGPPAPQAPGMGPGPGVAVPAQPSVPTEPLQPGSMYAPVQQVGGYGNPQSPNGTIGGGNATESSAHPVTGDEEDSFDLGPGRGGGGRVARGAENGPVFTEAPAFSGGEIPSSHLVRRGDTLWGLCDYYFKNPYEWPRIWSLNPQIKNPHWIYPGDELRLKEGGGAAEAATGAGASARGGGKMTLTDRRRQVPKDTVFLREQGWMADDSDEVWGDITGAAQDKMFLTDPDEVYLALRPGHDVQPGQELTIFRPRKTAAAGTIVQILGTVKVEDWNPKDRVARAKLVESLDVIERGANVGPIARSFDVVPPRASDADVQAHVLASVHPNEFFGQNQVVFIDKGEQAGLVQGNRLFVVRRGDAWRRSLVTPGAGYRVSPDDERPMPPMEATPGASRTEDKFPDEVVAELRVLAVKKNSAVCLVTHSKMEIEAYDLAVALKGK